MKLATYQFADGIGPALVIDGRLKDLRMFAATMIDILEGGDAMFESLREGTLNAQTCALDPQLLLAPVPAPRAFLGVGLNYRDHAFEVGRALPELPTVFAKLASSVASPYADIAAPRWSETFDYEGELGVVIGVEQSIAGYVIVNDFTVRALAKPETLTLGKSGPGHGPFGPFITTADEVVEPQALAITTHVNGELRQSSTTAQLHFSVAEIIAFVSRSVLLLPGDIITTGSPAGSGVGFTPPRWLAPGDVVRVSIEGLGHIETRIV